MSKRKIIVERIAYSIFAIDGGRRLKTWARIGAELKPITATTEERLRRKLRKVSVDLLNGDVDAAGLESGDHRSYLAASEALKPLGIGVDLAAREYAAARAELGGVSLQEAVRFYLQHSGNTVRRRTVAEVIEELFALRPKWSDAYREVIGYDLKRFARACTVQPGDGSPPVAGSQSIDTVTTEQLERVISETGRTIRGKFVPASDYRREQVRGELVTLFNFARKKRYLPRKLDTVAHELVAEDIIGEAREVWDPEHLRRALETVSAHDAEWLPWLAISALANVRSTPIRRLEWPDIHHLDSLIELAARKSKIKKRVTVTISETLASWLAPYRGRHGAIAPAKGFGSFITRLRRHDLPYYKNVLRRSFISYLLAETDDEEYVARVANTSVQKLRDNYRQIRTFTGRLVTKDLASAWFGTARVSAVNVVQLELPA